MKSVLVVSLIIGLSCPAYAGHVPFNPDNPENMKKVWFTLNDLCRGGSGDDPQTHVFCDQREMYSKKLEKANWCWGNSSDFDYQRTWARCH